MKSAEMRPGEYLPRRSMERIPFNTGVKDRPPNTPISPKKKGKKAGKLVSSRLSGLVNLNHSIFVPTPISNLGSPPWVEAVEKIPPEIIAAPGE